MIVNTTKEPLNVNRKDSKYYMITVDGGEVVVENIAYDTTGGSIELVKPILEPLRQD